MIVVSDTSPIRALGHLGRLDVLPVLFRQVLIPPAVQYELENPPNRFSPIGVSEVGWIQVEEITAVDRVNTLLQTLDSGESEALALALERRAEAILIDEAAGRSVAAELSLTPIGTLAILLHAKEHSLIDSIQPLMNRLQEELGFFINAELRDYILCQANE